MYPKLAITINGEPREAVVLEVPEPIPDLSMLVLGFEDYSAPWVSANRDDYRDGKYHFTPSRGLTGQPGIHRAQAVKICYTDGSSHVVPLRDEIFIEVIALAKAAAHRPVFRAE